MSDLQATLAALKEEGLSDRQAFLLLDAVADLRRTETQLSADMLSLSEHLAAARRNVGTGCLNSLGEVQGRGSSVDRLCGLAAARRESVAALCRLLEVDPFLVGL